jgi:hypothetical protein
MLTRALLWLLLPSAAIAQAQYSTAPKAASPAPASTGCPWITEGTAAAMLGGDVSVTVKITNPAETNPTGGSCLFTRQQGTAAYTLEVLVQKNPTPACPSGSEKLAGIGNEAARCKVQSTPNESVEMISTRVRDLYCTVTLTTPGSKDSAISLVDQKSAIERAAEQVTGNLY